MTEARWKILETIGKGLTLQEQKEGFHWCGDWDYMLVGPGMHAWECCTCKLEKDFWNI